MGGVSGDATGIECLAFHSRGHRALQFTKTFPPGPLRRNRGGGVGSRARLYFLVETQERVAQRLGTTRISSLGSGEARRKPRGRTRFGALARNPWPRAFLRHLSEETGRPGSQRRL